jgi:hypothetical protein
MHFVRVKGMPYVSKLLHSYRQLLYMLTIWWLQMTWHLVITNSWLSSLLLYCSWGWCALLHQTLEQSWPLITQKDAHQTHAALDGKKSSEFIAYQSNHHKSRKLQKWLMENRYKFTTYQSNWHNKGNNHPISNNHVQYCKVFSNLRECEWEFDWRVVLESWLLFPIPRLASDRN